MKIRRHKYLVQQLPNALDLLQVADGIHNGKGFKPAHWTAECLGSLVLAKNRSPKRHARFCHSLTVGTLQSFA
jgi:hypothetical protein